MSCRYLDLLRELLRGLSSNMPCRITIRSRIRISFFDLEIHDGWWPFSHAGEVSLFHSCDIRFMPLPDGPWEQAKEHS